MPRTENEARERALAPLSPDAVHHLETFVALLREWGKTHNLIGRHEFDRIWTRHVLDSLALAPLLNDGALIDLGSGAGFPGLVLALTQPDRRVTLVESSRRKAGFLSHVAGVTGVPVTVRPARIEAQPDEVFPNVSARALAPLSTLLTLSARFFGTETVGLFPKGREAATELSDAQTRHAFDAELVKSATDPDAAVIVVRHLAR